jgi:hypothetical protein
MDFNKLSANEKLAVYGAIASIVGALLSGFTLGGGGVLWFTLLLAIAMIAIVFLPQWSPQTRLPGSKGSLMLLVGGIAGVSALLALLSILPALGFLGLYGGLWFIGLLIGIVGGLVMGWAGWQEFQAEGGKFQLGTPAGGTTTAAPPSATMTDTTAPPPPAAPSAGPPPSMAPPPAAPPPATPPPTTAESPSYTPPAPSEPTMREPGTATPESPYGRRDEERMG